MHWTYRMGQKFALRLLAKLSIYSQTTRCYLVVLKVIQLCLSITRIVLYCNVIVLLLKKVMKFVLSDL